MNSEKAYGAVELHIPEHLEFGLTLPRKTVHIKKYPLKAHFFLPQI